MLSRHVEKLSGIVPERISGCVDRVVGLTAECVGLPVPVGSLCELRARETGSSVFGEVVGFSRTRSYLMPYTDIRGLAPGDTVRCISRSQTVPVGRELLGRVIDGRAKPIDGKGKLLSTEHWPLYETAPRPMERERVTEPVATGIRAIDALFTCGKGQRMGLFSGSGVGKSTLMGMIARNTSADVNVIGLVGERGRELRDFIEKDLGEEGLRRSVVVVATSDESPLIRVRAAFVATAIAEYFRNLGNDVMLLMDSVTRLAVAQRQIGLSIGEPPATKGYTPSVYMLLPQLLERTGQSNTGSITAFYTVLVEADDINEPVADTVRSILDGHVWLSRETAARGHYPAIDPLNSISRLMVDVTDAEHVRAATKMRSILATYMQAEDLINIGAYVKGSNPRIDEAVGLIDDVWAFLRQGISEEAPFDVTQSRLLEMLAGLEQPELLNTQTQIIGERAREAV